MSRITVLELYKEDMKFSAGHFTIFGPGRRERLHGHNFSVYAALTCIVPDEGFGVDYGVYKRKLSELCGSWNEYFLLPAKSRYLSIQPAGDQLIVRFGDEEIPFLRKDVLLLPIANVTVEELAALMLERLVAFRNEAGHDSITAVTVKVFSGPGQNASASWQLPRSSGAQ
jgi:6-pyruvoyltetrahydropterin/6-carboxytetrahydropterin synthase